MHGPLCARRPVLPLCSPARSAGDSPHPNATFSPQIGSPVRKFSTGREAALAALAAARAGEAPLVSPPAEAAPVAAPRPEPVKYASGREAALAALAAMQASAIRAPSEHPSWIPSECRMIAI